MFTLKPGHYFKYFLLSFPTDTELKNVPLSRYHSRKNIIVNFSVIRKSEDYAKTGNTIA